MIKSWSLQYTTTIRAALTSVHLMGDYSTPKRPTMTPNTPWSNGTVEVVNRALVRCLKALRLEFQLPFKSWPTLRPVVQSALNNTILPRLGNRSSTEVVLGLHTSSPITTAVVTKENKSVIYLWKKFERFRRTNFGPPLTSSTERLPASRVRRETLASVFTAPEREQGLSTSP
jgi:hypothetical protein